MSGKAIAFGGSRRTGSRWFRVLGLGFSLRSPRYVPSFGEQHGLRRALVSVGGWRLYLLLPQPKPRALPRVV